MHALFPEKIYLQSAFTEKRTFFCVGDLKTNLIYIGKLLLMFPAVLTCYIKTTYIRRTNASVQHARFMATFFLNYTIRNLLYVLCYSRRKSLIDIFYIPISLMGPSTRHLLFRQVREKYSFIIHSKLFDFYIFSPVELSSPFIYSIRLI